MTKRSSLFFPILETIIAFAWEPNGSKFAVLHGEAPRISVSFYHVKNNGKIELISKLAACAPTLRTELGRRSAESARRDRHRGSRGLVAVVMAPEGVCRKGRAFSALLQGPLNLTVPKSCPVLSWLQLPALGLGSRARPRSAPPGSPCPPSGQAPRPARVPPGSRRLLSCPAASGPSARRVRVCCVSISLCED